MEAQKAMAPPTQASQIGDRLKALRKSRGLTLQQLADRADLSISSLSQTERGLVSPTVRTIYSVCQALGVSPAWIIDPESAKDHNPDGNYIVRASRRTEVFNANGVVKQVATPAGEERYKAFIVDIDVGGSSGDDQYSHKGEEIGVVLQGMLVLQIEGKEYRLSKGDSFAFPSHIPHRFFNESNAPASVFWVNSLN